jgi:hypothetical protein
MKNHHANTPLLLEVTPSESRAAFELGAPLYAPPFFNTASPLHSVSLNDFGAETDFDDETDHGYDSESYKVLALSTPVRYGATGAHVVGEGALTRC